MTRIPSIPIEELNKDLYFKIGFNEDYIYFLGNKIPIYIHRPILLTSRKKVLIIREEMGMHMNIFYK